MRLTLKAINAELAKRGHQAVMENVMAISTFVLEAVDWMDRTVTVPTVGSLTLEQWIQAFRDLQKNAEIRRAGKPLVRPPKRTPKSGEQKANYAILPTVGIRSCTVSFDMAPGSGTASR
jgi:hypothetical protein